MKILKEIFRDQSLDILGKTDHRLAVRAVVIRDRTLLMIHSPVNGDYKFPGGGIGQNENPELALRREVVEECGMNLSQIQHGIGCVVEYAISTKAAFAVFKMTSSYYLCKVDSAIGAQHLDRYEKELGFQPIWIDIETAIQTNHTVLRTETKRPPNWTAREVFMLEYIKDHYLGSS
jgi:8-oxo-dGTP pyrophosphatase MutT (NUDIX family)